MNAKAARKVKANYLKSEELRLERELVLEKARRGVLNFTRYTKPDYEINWHHRHIARYLNRVAKGEITRLMINIQPRAGKSELVSRRFPAYYLGLNPDHQLIAASYSATLAARMNRDVQRIIDSPAYHDIFPGTALNSSNVRTTAQGSWLRNADEFEVVGRRGVYRSAGVGGATTGYGANLGIIDDPVKNRDEANSQTFRDKVWDWYTSTFFTRLEKGGRIILCMTRWHEDDLAGRLLRHAKKNPDVDQWTVITFPSIHEGETHEYDPRQKGEALWPNKYNLKRLHSMKETMGERDWASLYQQRPAPAAGNVIKKEWWSFYEPEDLPEDLDIMVASADLSLKDNQRADFTVITIWGRRGNNQFYLIDMVRDRMGWIRQKAAFDRVMAHYPDLNAIYIEDAAAGVQLIQEAKAQFPGIVAVKAKGSKLTRLEAVAGLIESGSVHLPNPNALNYSWVHEVINELAVFPNGAHDDIVDSVSMALSRMRSRTATWDFTPEGIVKQQGAPAF